MHRIVCNLAQLLYYRNKHTRYSGCQIALFFFSPHIIKAPLFSFCQSSYYDENAVPGGILASTRHACDSVTARVEVTYVSELILWTTCAKNFCSKSSTTQ